MSIGSLALAFLAGVLSILSPCVLPLLPIVLGAAASEHRWGPVALASGVTLSFITIGLFVATIGFTLGYDDSWFRNIAAIGMILIGTVLLVPSFQLRVAFVGGPMSDWADQRFGGFSKSGLSGQFGVGLLLGAVWSPCVGPTLGAASVLAAQGKNLGAVALTMLIFGLGAGLPLMLFGSVSRQLLLRWRGGLSATSKTMKQALGLFLIVIGLLIVTGLDKSLETGLVELSPQWLTNITTRL
ncbi:cytochrome c biogenesis CcdA family protein [Bradyrhizobium sp. Ash2021]|uniref:cytochrome c biogenesis CcdA family protein n=1 Tax=Bradyrhizobium sp. Ash2021 TaxID=2954771 RepID=UPI00281671DC|nr:cytochrome c biogenesis CcdA family protein [Bradyrhizobium sp. Ash2021]WMT72139.1 cytochrome c biogenesis CcdA family protein [Bradyrhizobium sp. Ash2021]